MFALMLPLVAAFYADCGVTIRHASTPEQMTQFLVDHRQHVIVGLESPLDDGEDTSLTDLYAAFANGLTMAQCQEVAILALLRGSNGAFDGLIEREFRGFRAVVWGRRSAEEALAPPTTRVHSAVPEDLFAATVSAAVRKALAAPPPEEKAGRFDSGLIDDAGALGAKPAPLPDWFDEI